MDAGDIIAILALAAGVVGSVLDKRLKKTNTRKSSPPPIDPFPATFDEYEDDEGPYSYDKKVVIKETPKPAPVMSSQTPIYKSVEELPISKPAYKTVMIESASAEMKLDDLTAINLESVYNDEDKKARAFNIDLRAAVIYSEILKPKFDDF